VVVMAELALAVVLAAVAPVVISEIVVMEQATRN